MVDLPLDERLVEEVNVIIQEAVQRSGGAWKRSFRLEVLAIMRLVEQFEHDRIFRAKVPESKVDPG